MKHKDSKKLKIKNCEPLFFDNFIFFRAAGAMLLISGMVSAYGLNLCFGTAAVAILTDRIFRWSICRAGKQLAVPEHRIPASVRLQWKHNFFDFKPINKLF